MTDASKAGIAPASMSVDSPPSGDDAGAEAQAWPVDAGDLPAEAMMCFALYSASHAMHRVYRPWLDRMGLTYPQFLTMTALWRRDARTVGELCAELRLATSTLTPLLKRLEAEGLVQRARDPRDARAVRVRLTEKGAALRARSEGLTEAVHGATGLSVEQARALTRAVACLRDRLESHADRIEREEVEGPEPEDGAA